MVFEFFHFPKVCKIHTLLGVILFSLGVSVFSRGTLLNFHVVSR